MRNMQISRWRCLSHWGKKILGFNRKKHVGLFLILAVVFGSLFLIEPVFAQTDSGEGFANWLVQIGASVLLYIARLFIGLTVFALRMFIEVAKYNGYIDAPTVVVGWVMVRDVANMGFIVILLVIAFGTILGIEQYEWKKSLGKLILAAIFINFSKTIAGLIIDVAHVFTITFLNAVSAAAGGNLINMFQLNNILKMTSNFDPASSGDFRLQLFVSALLAVAFSVFAMVTVAAYTIVMVARLVVLWILIVLSPLAYIFQVIPATQKYAQEWWSEFGKHVLVAPIMVFFLWLAFATIGSGNITQSVGINVEAGEAETVLAGASDGNALSLTEVSTWENMANFIIAIAFLVYGLKKVNQLGVQAGGLAAGALDFGKKVVTIATGYALGRAIVDKGVEFGGLGLKEGARRVPLIGGAALEEYKTAAGAKYKMLTTRSKINRSKTAADWQKAGAKEGATAWEKFRGVVGARFVEPAERAEKRSKDWQTAVERTEKILEESYSTSISKAGQAKLDATVEMKMTEEMAGQKGAQKVEERIREASAINDIAEKMATDRGEKKEDLLKNESFLKDVQEEYLAGVPEKDKKKVEGLLNRDGGVASRLTLAERYNGQLGAYSKAKASVETLQQRYNEYDKQKAVATQRDSLLIANGEKPRYVKALEASRAEEIGKEYGAMNFREVTNAAIFAAQELQAEIAKGTSADRGKVKRLMQSAAMGLIMNMKKGSENGMAVLDSATKNIFNEDVVAGDPDAAARKILSAITGQTVEKGGIKAAEARMAEVLGDEGANLIKRELAASLVTASADGAVNMAGLIYDRDYDSDSGVVDYRFMDVSDQSIARDRKGNAILDKNNNEQTWEQVYRKTSDGVREYMAQENTATKITGLKDMLGKKSTGQNDFLIPVQAAAREAMEKNFTQIFGNITYGTKLHSRLVAELEDLGEAEAKQFIPLFEALADKNAEAAGHMINKLGSFGKIIKRNNGRLNNIAGKVKGGREDEPDE